jgi:hypothetical protein
VGFTDEAYETAGSVKTGNILKEITRETWTYIRG